MPIYEYGCSECGKLQDVLQKVSDPAPEKCEHCGAAGTLSRKVSRTSFVLKGGGWYSDLYGSTKKSGEAGASSSSSSSPSSSSASSGGGKTESASSSSGTATSTPAAASSGGGSSKS